MIHRSPYPDVNIPDVPISTFVLERAKERGDKPAMTDGATGEVLTYAGLVDAVERTAFGLYERGFGKDDVLAIYAPNCPQYAVAFHACAAVGGICTTVNPLYTAAELTRQLNDAGAKYLVTTSDHLERARLAVQAKLDGRRLMSKDRKLERYGVQRIW